MPRDFTLMQLRSFVEVADAGSFRAAAESLHIAQPPLTRHVQALERSFGVALLDRRVDGVVPTRAGRVLLPEARTILALAAQAHANVAEVAEGARTVLRVGYLEPVALDLIPRVLPRFEELMPHVEVELYEMNSYEAVQRLTARAVDVALLRPPVESTEVDLTFLHNERLVAVLPSAHPLAGGRIDLASLRDEAFVTFAVTQGAGTHAAMLHACSVAGFVPRVVQLATSVPALMATVAGGKGVGMLVHQFAAIARPGVRFSQLNDEAAVVPLAVARMHSHHSLATDVFIGVCRDVTALADGDLAEACDEEAER